MSPSGAALHLMVKARNWRSEVRAASWLLGADILSRAAGQIAVVATARLLGADAYGALAVGLAVFAITLVLADLGVGDAAVQRLTTREAGGEEFWRELSLVRVILAVPLAIAGLVVFLVAGQPAVRTSALLITVLPFACLLSGRALHARITERFPSAGGWASLLLLCQWLGALLGVLFMRSAVAAATGVLVALSVASLLAVRRYQWRWPDRRIAFEWLRRGRPFFVTAIAVAAYSRGDRIVVAVIDGTTAAGVYAAAYSLVMITAIGGAGLHAAVLPRLIRENRAGVGLRWQRRAAFLSAAAVPAAILLAFQASWIMETIYGEDFGGGNVLRALSPLVVLYLLNPFLSSCLIAAGEQKSLAKVAIANCLLALIAYPILTLQLGVVGTALASLAVEVLGTCLVVIRLHRVSGERAVALAASDERQEIPTGP